MLVVYVVPCYSYIYLSRELELGGCPDTEKLFIMWAYYLGHSIEERENVGESGRFFLFVDPIEFFFILYSVYFIAIPWLIVRFLLLLDE